MKVIYSKTSDNRKKEFQIVTRIIKDDNDNIFVSKKSLFDSTHIKNTYDHYLKLKDIYSLSETKLVDDELISEYVKGKSLESIFFEDEKSAIKIYKELLSTPSNMSSFIDSEEFRKVFKNIKLSESTPCMKISNVDLIFSNIISRQADFVIIDLEWVFDFTIPLDFITYRAIKELYSHKNIKTPIEKMITKFDIKMDLKVLEEMDNCFNEYVGSGESIKRFMKQDHYIFTAIDSAQKEINRLNKEINKLGAWGKKVTSELEGANKLITSLSKENTDLGSWGNKLNEQLDLSRKEIERLNNELNKVGEWGKKLNDELVVSSKEITRLNNEIIKLGSWAKKLDKEIETLQERIKDKDFTIEELKSKIDELNNEIQTLITKYEAKIKDIEKKLEETNAEMVSRGEHIKKLDNQIEDILRANASLNNELNEIKGSSMYKFSLGYYKVRDFFFPPNSKRKAAAKVVLKPIRHPIWFIKHLSPINISKFFKYSRSEGFHRAIERMDVYQENNTDIRFDTTLVLEDMNPRDTYDVLEFPKYKKPEVSIIIPVYNQFSYTYGCLLSILKYTQGISYEVIIADDCSTDETKNISKYVKNIKVVKTETNVRFLLNCNNAAKQAKGKYIFFLNNDTNVQPNYLSSLLETIKSNPKIGLVGSKLVYPNGQLQEAGGILWRDGSAWNYGNKSDPQNSEYSYRKPVDYISGAAILTKTSLWKEIGGFDERFVPAYCEDSDYCFEVRKHGYEVIFDPFSVVVHYEGISNGTDVTTGVKKYQVDNSKKFLEKWKDELNKHYPNGENVFIARERSFNKKTMLVIDHYVPQYDKDAGSRTVFAYLKLFVNMGYNVKFMGENFYRHEPYTQELQKMGIEVLYGPYYGNNYKEWLKINGKHFDYVFMNRPHITNKFIDDVKDNCYNAKIIYYGHDLHFVRCLREYEVKQDPKMLEEAKKWEKIEFDIYHKVDLVLYPSSLEKDEILKRDPSIHCEVLQPYLCEHKEYKEYNYSSRNDILFVGGFRHGPNFDGIMWFINDVFPNVLKKNKDMKLIVAGSYPPDELKGKASDNVIIKGFVSDEELANLYKSVRMVVVPLRYGAGIKGKVIEAMENNVPLITTPCGGEGIFTDAIIIDETLAKLSPLYNNKKQLMSLSKKEYDFINKEYSFESAKEKFIKLIESIK